MPKRPRAERADEAARFGMDQETHFIGVDGGGSGCRVRLVDASGRRLAEAQGGPANIALDPEGAISRILTAARAAAAEISDTPEALLAKATAVLGLAGANVAGAAERVLPALPFAQSRIVSDAVTTLHGALGMRDGIVAALGTGSVFAAARDGSFEQIGGWGFLLGDEASGGQLGKALLSAAVRAVDGLAPMTPLLAETLEELGGPEAVVPFVLKASSADIARLAPRLFTTQDPTAEAILAEAEAYLKAAITRLSAEAKLPVCWIGGLGPAWANRLGHLWPQHEALGTALDGAVLLAQRMPS